MKTTCFTLLLALVVSLAVNAQTQKGTKMIGGGGSADFENGFYISLVPNLGYFVADNVAVGSGLSLSYGYDKTTTYNTVGAGILPFVRYYFGQQSATRLFAVANGSLITEKARVDINGVKEFDRTFNSCSFGGGLGVVHLLSDQVGLEAQLLYRNSKSYYNIYYDDILPSWNGRFGLSLGVQIHLPRKTDK